MAQTIPGELVNLLYLVAVPVDYCKKRPCDFMAYTTLCMRFMALHK